MLFRWLFTAFVLARSGAERVCNDAAVSQQLAVSALELHTWWLSSASRAARLARSADRNTHTLDSRVRAKPRADLA